MDPLRSSSIVQGSIPSLNNELQKIKELKIEFKSPFGEDAKAAILKLKHFYQIAIQKPLSNVKSELLSQVLIKYEKIRHAQYTRVNDSRFECPCWLGFSYAALHAALDPTTLYFKLDENLEELEEQLKDESLFCGFEEYLQSSDAQTLVDKIHQREIFVELLNSLCFIETFHQIRKENPVRFETLIKLVEASYLRETSEEKKIELAKLFCRIYRFTWQHQDPEIVKIAMMLLEKALELDPSPSRKEEVNNLRYSYFKFAGNWQEAKKHLQLAFAAFQSQSEEEDPNYPFTFINFRSRFDECALVEGLEEVKNLKILKDETLHRLYSLVIAPVLTSKNMDLGLELRSQLLAKYGSDLETKKDPKSLGICYAALNVELKAFSWESMVLCFENDITLDRLEEVSQDISIFEAVDQFVKSSDAEVLAQKIVLSKERGMHQGAILSGLIRGLLSRGVNLSQVEPFYKLLKAIYEQVGTPEAKKQLHEILFLLPMD